ncbi:hypothetical protein B0H10DRAFT_2224123 [Mycena sp. CBHHK59/15]|nr:hypothetical protein B0H10DRAFT_2224123 [Mycena sp. CBHHK59/15]
MPALSAQPKRAQRHSAQGTPSTVSATARSRSRWTPSSAASSSASHATANSTSTSPSRGTAPGEGMAAYPGRGVWGAERGGAAHESQGGTVRPRTRSESHFSASTPPLSSSHSFPGHGDTLQLQRMPSRLGADGPLAARLSGWFAHLAGCGISWTGKSMQHSPSKSDSSYSSVSSASSCGTGRSSYSNTSMTSSNASSNMSASSSSSKKRWWSLGGTKRWTTRGGDASTEPAFLQRTSAAHTAHVRLLSWFLDAIGVSVAIEVTLYQTKVFAALHSPAALAALHAAKPASSHESHRAPASWSGHSHHSRGKQPHAKPETQVWGDHPVLLLIGTRLGQEGVNPVSLNDQALLPFSLSSLSCHFSCSPSSFIVLPLLSHTIFAIQEEPPTWSGTGDDDKMGLESISDPEGVEDAGFDDGDVSSASHAPSSNASHAVSTPIPPQAVACAARRSTRRRTPSPITPLPGARFDLSGGPPPAGKGTSSYANLEGDDGFVDAGSDLDIEDDWVDPVAPPPVPSKKGSKGKGKSKSKSRKAMPVPSVYYPFPMPIEDTAAPASPQQQERQRNVTVSPRAGGGSGQRMHPARARDRERTQSGGVRGVLTED